MSLEECELTDINTEERDSVTVTGTVLKGAEVVGEISPVLRPRACVEGSKRGNVQIV